MDVKCKMFLEYQVFLVINNKIYRNELLEQNLHLIL